MQLQGSRSAAGAMLRRTPRGDRIVRSVIVGTGVAVLLLLAWVHLGLGALLFPPSATPARVTATTDGRSGYVVTLATDSGALDTGGGNVVTFLIQDSHGAPLPNATVRVHADMTTMAMPVPDASATAQGHGRYVAHLIFTMAGTWRLTVTIQAPGQAPVHATFDVGVRWH